MQHLDPGSEGRCTVAMRMMALLAGVLVMGAVLFPVRAQSPVEAAPLDVECNSAIYQFLPGEVNYCLGLKMWGRKNYRQGEAYFLLAAGWGSKPAQYALGIAYFNGDGVSVDRPLGLAWLRLSAERKAPVFLMTAESVKASLTAEEIRRADALFEALLPRYGDDVAALRARKKYDREIAAIAGNKAYRPRVCISGLNSGGMNGNSEEADACPQAERAVTALDEISEQYFKGWKDRVEVGPLEQVAKPSTTP